MESLAAYTVRFLDISLWSVPSNWSLATSTSIAEIHKPPRVLYNDSAAKHVDARASANAHKNAEGSICIYLWCIGQDKAR